MTTEVRQYCNYAMGLKVWGSNPGTEKTFFSYPYHTKKAWGPQNLLFNGYRNFFPGVKLGGAEVDHSYPSNAKVTLMEVYIYSPIRLQMT
jgi:hypothetical protein